MKMGFSSHEIDPATPAGQLCLKGNWGEISPRTEKIVGSISTTHINNENNNSWLFNTEIVDKDWLAYNILFLFNQPFIFKGKPDIYGHYIGL